MNPFECYFVYHKSNMKYPRIEFGEAQINLRYNQATQKANSDTKLIGTQSFQRRSSCVSV